MLTQLDGGHIYTLLTQTYPDLLTEFLKSLRIVSSLDIVMTILDIIEFLFGLDAEYGLSGA